MKLIDFFLFKKNKVNFKDSKIMHLVRTNRIEEIDFNRLKINKLLYKNINQESFIQLLIQFKKNEYLKKVLSNYPEMINQPSGVFDQTPLMIALHYSNIEAFKIILSLSPDINLLDKNCNHILSSVFNRKEFYNLLRDHLRLEEMSSTLRKKIIISYSQPFADQSIVLDLINLNILKGLTNKDLSLILKFMLKNFKYEVSECIGKEIKESHDFILEEKNLISSFHEGFYKSKLIIKQTAYIDKFKFNQYKSYNFHKIIGLSKKDIIREFYQSLIISKYSFIPNIAEINTELIETIYFLKKRFKIDENLLRPLFNKQLNFEINEEFEDFLTNLLNNWNHRRIVFLISNSTSYIELRDSAYMYESISRYCFINSIDIKIFLPEKPKSFREIHDSLQKVLSKIGKDKIPIGINLPDNVKDLNLKKFENFEIRIPKNNYDLIVAGQHLSICIGNNFYANEMNKGRIAIFILYQGKTPEYCVEFDLGLNKIIQAKSHYNFDMDKDFKKRFESFILMMI